MSDQEQQTKPDGGASVSTAMLGAWVQSRDRAPRDNQEVLIAVEWSDGKIDVCAGQLHKGRWYGSWFDEDEPIQEIFGVVLAWMPYPEYAPNKEVRGAEQASPAERPA